MCQHCHCKQLALNIHLTMIQKASAHAGDEMPHNMVRLGLGVSTKKKCLCILCESMNPRHQQQPKCC